MINKNDKKIYLKEHLEFINKYPLEVWSKIYELEENFKKHFNIKYASACSSWSTWLILALKSIWLKKQDEVLMNKDYFISDPNSVKILWWKSIFINSWKKINTLSLKEIKEKITKKTKAIIIIHMYGYPIENTKKIINYCKKNNIIVIEDCCQSIWAKIWEKFIWTFWDIWVFSFDTNKMVKWWEWWMIISNNSHIIEQTRLYKNNCKREWKFIDLWYNFRYNDFSAIYAKYSLKNLWELIEIREKTIKNIINYIEKNNIDIKIYLWWKNIFPNFYNLIYKKNNKYKILELPYNQYEDKNIDLLNLFNNGKSN